MSTLQLNRKHNRQAGQTLIVAILVLGVLLILGFAFAGIISRNVTQTAQSRQRTVASELAEAGIRLAHAQLLNSALGADWRPEPSVWPIDPQGLSRDPDALYLRAGTGFGMRSDADAVLDRGGPDGLGSYTRFFTERGRYLVRVRYAPSDLYVNSTPNGDLRQPGRVRNYLIIEAIGRPGRVDANDPTTLLNEAFRVRNYPSSAAFRTELGRMRARDGQLGESSKLMAFASIGIIESARFITNKFNVSRPAEIGSLTAASGRAARGDLGLTYQGNAVQIVTQMGNPDRYTGGNDASRYGEGGSLVSNADLLLHGTIVAALDPGLGDMWAVAGDIRPANNASRLTVVTPNGTTSTVPNSRDSNFSTLNGLVRDGVQDTDQAGYPRSVARKEPPSMLTVDPATGTNRYREMTRSSGPVVNGRNIGRFGYGRGIYVDSYERANTLEEDVDAMRSLPNDWLNPNNPNSVGWQGPYYIPTAAYLRLLPDGFQIIRDSASENNTWRNVDGTQANTSSARFLLRRIGGQTYIVNSILSPNIVNAAPGTISDSDFRNAGQPFNGVLYFEGDVRVRGIIPTNQQITVSSMGTIYIEGSITKGDVLPNGARINNTSSMLMLMARDFIAVNTTMFFGPIPGENPKAKNATPLPDTPNPVELDLSETSNLTLQAQFLREPSSGSPYAQTYAEWSGNEPLNARLLLSHSADDGGPSFVGLDITPLSFSVPNSPTEPYLFPASATFNQTAFSVYGTGLVPVYALAGGLSAFPRFESVALPLTGPGSGIDGTGRRLTTGSVVPGAEYLLALNDETAFNLRIEAAGVGPFSPKNYALARAAVVPHDIRIEAAMYAEEGSFFVIPGPPFNTNSEDTRERFNERVSSGGLASATLDRLQNFGAYPETPFYNEPLNVRITVVGAVSENMPPPMSQQAAWQRRWGWMPGLIGGTGQSIPVAHVPSSISGFTADTLYVPNLIVQYDPVLGLASLDGNSPLRVDSNGWVLPPMPRLPVSPTLAYFGEVNP